LQKLGSDGSYGLARIRLLVSYPSQFCRESELHLRRFLFQIDEEKKSCKRFVAREMNVPPNTWCVVLLACCLRAQ
jgi:hypothetical protein